MIRRLAPVTGLSLCTAIPIILGWLLIVPGIILNAMWFVSLPACVVEGTGVVASMSRSLALTKGCRWRLSAAVTVSAMAGWLVDYTLALDAAAIGTAAVAISRWLAAAVMLGFNGVFGGVVYYQLAAREARITTVFD